MIKLRFEEQDPLAFLTYELDLTAHATEEGSTIVGCVWSVVPIPDDATPLNVSSQTNIGNPITLTRLRLQGGTEGLDYRVRAILTYANGSIEPLSFNLKIGET